MSGPDEHSTLSGSITRLIRRLPSNDHHSARRLFDFYFERLAALARKRLGEADRRMRDEEDIVGEVLAKFLLDGGQGQLPVIGNRTDLLRMLYNRVNQRVRNAVRDANRLKRGGGRVSTEGSLSVHSDKPLTGLDALPGEARSPDVELIDLEELQALNDRIMRCLPEDQLRPYAQHWLQGDSTAEIARALNVSRSTVYRKMDIVFGCLRIEFAEDARK
jgi:RNA polymerase sigma factor (sigma-70 family)